MGLVLWHLELSHYSEKARWALDFRQIPHTRRAAFPGFHQLLALWLTRGEGRRMPVLSDGGRNVAGSGAIIAEMERRFPRRPLYPGDPQERARALELAEWFDANLGSPVRRFTWHHMLTEPELVPESLFTGESRVRRRLIAATRPAVGLFVRRDFGIDDASALAARDRIRAAMDRLEYELGDRDYLAGATFSVADLTAAALLTPLLAPPGRPFQPPRDPAAVRELRAELDARPGGRWVTLMYQRHRAVSVGSSH